MTNNIAHILLQGEHFTRTNEKINNFFCFSLNVFHKQLKKYLISLTRSVSIRFKQPDMFTFFYTFEILYRSIFDFDMNKVRIYTNKYTPKLKVKPLNNNYDSCCSVVKPINS